MIKNFENFINRINDNIECILEESFNDKNISNAIKEHGGLDNKWMKRFGASINANYDIQNSEYCGYLTSETVSNLDETDLIYGLGDRLLFTNDGGAVVIKNTYMDKESDWDKKVRNRNAQWRENVSDKDKYEEEKYVKPNRFNTYYRRRERKNIN